MHKSEHLTLDGLDFSLIMDKIVTLFQSSTDKIPTLAPYGDLELCMECNASHLPILFSFYVLVWSENHVYVSWVQ